MRGISILRKYFIESICPHRFGREDYAELPLQTLYGLPFFFFFFFPPLQKAARRSIHAHNR